MAITSLPDNCRDDFSLAEAQIATGRACSRLIAGLLNCALTSHCPCRSNCVEQVKTLLCRLPQDG